MKMKCQVCSPNIVEESEGGGGTHGHVILLHSINYPNNFVLKKV